VHAAGRAGTTFQKNEFSSSEVLSTMALCGQCTRTLTFGDFVFEQLSEGKKKYFYAQMLGYVLGLVTTVIMMIQFKAAQPALLYLVPV
jgi:hypothetical protein